MHYGSAAVEDKNMNTSTITEHAPPPSPTSNPQPSKLLQLEQLLKQGKVLLQDLRTRLQDATRERDQLAATLTERDASHEKLWAEQADLQRADSERHQRELAELRTQLGEAVAARDAAVATRNELESQVHTLEGIRSQLDEAVAGRTHLGEQLRESEAQRGSLEKALATAVDEFEQLRTDADRAAALAREIFETHSK